MPVDAPDKQSELGDLKADIKAHGLLQNIVLFEGKILDGRSRYLACQLTSHRFTPADFVSFQDLGWNGSPAEYVWSSNVSRRHLTPDQRVALAIPFAEEKRREAKKRQKEHAGTAPGRGKPSADASEVSASVDTRRELAERAEVSEKKAQQAIDVSVHAPEEISAVVTGKKTLAEANAVAQTRKAAAGKVRKPRINLPSLGSTRMLTERSAKLAKSMSRQTNEYRQLAGRDLKPTEVALCDALTDLIREAQSLVGQLHEIPQRTHIFPPSAEVSTPTAPPEPSLLPSAEMKGVLTLLRLESKGVNWDDECEVVENDPLYDEVVTIFSQNVDVKPHTLKNWFYGIGPARAKRLCACAAWEMEGEQREVETAKEAKEVEEEGYIPVWV